jgi:hypothetical protein
MVYNRKMTYVNTSSCRCSQKRKPKRKLKTKTTFAKRVKRVILKTCEPKRAPVAVTKIEVFHNLMLGQTYLLNQAGVMSTTGTIQQSSRIGDQIMTSGWKIRCLFGQKADRPNVSWRFMVFQVPKDGSTAYADVFKSITGNVMLDEPNTDTTKVLFQRTFKPNDAGLQAAGGREYTFIKKWFVPHKKTYKFGPAESAQTHNQSDVYVLVLCYDAFGSVITDNIGYMQMFHEL